ncbi:FKBP-type peptidyl-prolyl cis-trans isomerase [Sphingobacterium suaedae]|uniref:Peptidyl-prolyl cis-trans isomerase n=1 Tax=Sphingobacterium suaedae TaxID=1686402 RepID=A0ABW5KJJ7_9SPHI
MKKLTTLLVVIALAILGFSACSKSDDYDYQKALEEQRIKDSIDNVRKMKLVTEQAAALKAFADEHMPGATLDDSTGIWLQINAPGDNNSYGYKVDARGYIIAPKITVKYKGTLLDGTVFDQTETDKTAEFSLGGVIAAWQWAFLPANIRFNGNDYPTSGLTVNGLKKGAKFKIVTPSPWAYDTQAKSKEGKVIIPANSPLFFEIEVIDIK